MEITQIDRLRRDVLVQDLQVIAVVELVFVQRDEDKGIRYN